MRKWLRRDLRRNVPTMGQAPEVEANGTADGESYGAEDVYDELTDALEASYAKNRSLRRHIKKMQEGRNGWHIKAGKLQSQVDELQKQVSRLKAERDGWRMRCGRILDAVSVARAIADEWDEEA